jgi:hypothetical protein
LLVKRTLVHVYSYINSIKFIYKQSDWGTLVPRINVKNVIKLGFVLEKMNKGYLKPLLLDRLGTLSIVAVHVTHAIN